MPSYTARARAPRDPHEPERKAVKTIVRRKLPNVQAAVVRMAPADREVLIAAAKEVGSSVSPIARFALEVLVRRLRAGVPLIKLLREMEMTAYVEETRAGMPTGSAVLPPNW